MDPDRYAEIKAMQSQHPEMFEMYPFPSVWCRENELNTYVDAPMHLLFLGITRHLAKYIQEWIALKRMTPKFLNYAKGLLEPIQRINLSWCTVIPYKGQKLGGWVSENYLGFGRLFPWFYQGLIHFKEKETFQNPDRPMNKWTAKENREWLGIRGLEKSGNARELREREYTIMLTWTVDHQMYWTTKSQREK